jgi:glycoside/pentoside/hexuronide:cation symporter, GPH family
VTGHFAMAVCLAVIIFASSVACFTMTAKAPFTVREEHVTYPLSQQISSVLSNKPFFILILCKFLTLMSLGTQAVFPFFFSRILGIDDSYLGYYFLISSLLLIFSQPLWLWLSRRFGKRNTFMMALLLSAPAWLSWFLASEGEPMMLVYLRAVVIGVAGGGAILMGQSMLPDTIEYDYRRTGLRREGIFAGFYTTVEKLSGAIGIAVVGAFLSAAGYIQSRGVAVDQPPSAIQAIYISIAVIPAVISVAAAIALIWYDLSEARLKDTRVADPISPTQTDDAILEAPRA